MSTFACDGSKSIKFTNNEQRAVIIRKHSSGKVCYFLKIFIVNSTGWYWTGGTDVITEGEWVWPMTGTPLTLFDDWKEGEPNGHNGGEDCLE